MKIDEIEIRGEVSKKESNDEECVDYFLTAFEKTTIGRTLLKMGYICQDDEIEDESEKTFYVRIVYKK